jgi:predicted RNase H-like HicB family nuclease
MEYIINLNWDEEAGVWIATSSDIKGLVLESSSLEKLKQRVRSAVPELIELNGLKKDIPLRYKTEKHKAVYV